MLSDSLISVIAPTFLSYLLIHFSVQRERNTNTILCMLPFRPDGKCTAVSLRDNAPRKEYRFVFPYNFVGAEFVVIFEILCEARVVSLNFLRFLLCVRFDAKGSFPLGEKGFFS